MRRILLIVLLLWGMGTAHETLAQKHPSLIPFMGYEIGAPYSMEREPGVVNRSEFGSDGYGFSVNHTAILGVLLSFPNLLESPFGLAFQANVIQSDGRFTSNPYAGRGRILSSLSGLPVAAETRFEVRATESQGQMALLGTWRPWKEGLVMLGPWIGYRFSSNLSLIEEIISPNYAVFADGEERRRTIAAGAEITSFAWRSGGVGGLMHMLPLSSVFRLAPFVTVRFDAESLFDKRLGRRAFSAGGGVGFAVDLFSSDASSPAPPIVEPPSIPSHFALSAAVHLRTADSVGTLRSLSGTEGKRLPVLTEQILHTRYIPLVPLVRCAPGESRLATDCRLLTRQQADSFAAADLIEKELSAIERERLNIVGERMRENPKEPLLLTGLYSDEEEKGLGIERAETLRRYFSEVWGIDSLRLRIAGTEKGREGGVRLASASPFLLAPLVQEWKGEEFIVPSLSLQKEITAQAGVQRWEITVRQGDRVIGRLHSESDEKKEFSSLSFDQATTRQPLVADLTVTDYTGAVVTAHDTLLLVPVPEVRQRTSYTWQLFDPALDSSFDGVNNAFIELITAATGENGQINVQGTPSGTGTDFGREGVAQTLLQRLLQSGLSAAALTIKPFPADTPPCSAFRSVVVTLE